MEHPDGDVSHDEEMAHWRNIAASFMAYPDWAFSRLSRHQRSFEILESSPAYAGRIPAETIARRMAALKRAVFTNMAVVGDVLQDLQGHSGEAVAGAVAADAQDADVERIVATLRQCAREWGRGEEYEKLRGDTFGKLLEEMRTGLAKFGDGLPGVPAGGRERARVLVPGCGLARLVYDVTRAGADCEGNEFSVHMLAFSHFILNSGRLMQGGTVEVVRPSLPVVWAC